MEESACSSGCAHTSRKRKQPDNEDQLPSDGPLSIEPIENEYENYSDDDLSDGPESSPTVPEKFKLDDILEGQEPATLTKIDGIKLTPFNLKEELEEGEFDKQGNYVFKKRLSSDTDDEENDTWAETVDWDEVERREKVLDKPKEVQSNPEDLPAKKQTHSARDKLGCYKAMLRLMKPNEVVKKTIQRLGSNIPKRKPLNKNRRQHAPMTGTELTDLEESKRKLDLMIELAHDRFQEGDMDIYQKTYENLEEAINY